MSFLSLRKRRPDRRDALPAPHPVDEVLPAHRLALLGLQHLCIMYSGAVAVPLIVGAALKLPISTIGLLVSADLLVSGIATVLQSVGIGRILGVRLPVVAGATFTVVNPMIIVAEQYGMAAVYGAMLVAGVFAVLIAKPFSMVLRYFPPLVSGTVICVIGLSLVGADVGLIAGDDPAAADYAQVSHILLAGAVIVLIIVFTRLFRGFIQQIALLLAIGAGTLIAWPMHLLDFSSATGAGWFGITAPFFFGPPKFEAAAIITMCVVVLVTYTESTADMVAVGEMVDRDLTPNDLARGLAVDGVSTVLAGVMNSFPDTAYAENVGLVGLTKVRSRWVVAVCGVLLIIVGLVPKIGQIVASIPGPVIGGAATVMFAMVTAVGIRTLHKASFKDNQNLLIVAVSLAVGLLPAVAPHFYDHFPQNFQVIFGSSITATVIVVFVLNLVFNHWVKRPSEPDPGTDGHADEGNLVLQRSHDDGQ
ncbi:uracil-xanthine permease family protein [Amycolatopsis jejuensis]|uniref:uracil-xanthine permease family protein n=1 Tax=Amycolatopsis jejuensis TaxID=330084 RepID=UPI0007C59ED0|nr:nucleobase:cation symporter-2 family protein [Amycolatopsis jejuensis]